jgi:hypothetical protein
MAVVFRSLARSQASGAFRPKGDLIYFAVADEEAGSAHARWSPTSTCDPLRLPVDRSGGLIATGRRSIDVTVGEKGVAWRRLRVHA